MAVTVRIDANLEWKVYRDPASSLWIGECPVMNLTVATKYFDELTEHMHDAIAALLRSLVRENELEDFLQKKGWSMIDPPAKITTGTRFEVPWGMLVEKRPARQIQA